MANKNTTRLLASSFGCYPYINTGHLMKYPVTLQLPVPNIDSILAACPRSKVYSFGAGN